FVVCIILPIISKNILKTETLFPNQNQDGNVTSVIRSDLIIPNETVLIERSALMSQIDEGFRTQNAIQAVALIGIAGSGKTTIARQYAKRQKAKLIWEINAETRE